LLGTRSRAVGRRLWRVIATDTRAGREMGQLSFTDEQIDVLSPDATVVTARWHLMMHDGKNLDGLTTIICKLKKEGWKIIHDHSS
jgi:ketosteroid isomerase-like protein